MFLLDCGEQDPVSQRGCDGAQMSLSSCSLGKSSHWAANTLLFRPHADPTCRPPYFDISYLFTVDRRADDAYFA